MVSTTAVDPGHVELRPAGLLWGSGKTGRTLYQGIGATSGRFQYPPSPNEVDERRWRNLWEKGRVGLAECASATGWVESLRGNQ